MTTTTTPAAPPADPPEQTLSQELAAIEVQYPGWALHLSEDGNVWMQSVTGIVRWAQTPALARYAIAVWEHEASARCQLPAVAA